ncbi:hypothetical protein [Crossiella cryophila]|uniref:Uncharacterized protein n=1 Tax=Crossiella cryophila TaxID=43355 RepID=A0A7W7CE54_9PSEU|nr:hypothetical protein [Crossiella cryophila]MBB4679496.1 hypothetical protein [Crossiella cryophila]
MWTEVIGIVTGVGPWAMLAGLGAIGAMVCVVFMTALRRANTEGREVSADASVFRVIKVGVKLGAPAERRPGGSAPSVNREIT